MDFQWPAHILDLAARTKQFVEAEVIPHEAHAREQHGLSEQEIHDLQNKARAAGLYGPQLPTELGGLGLNILEIAPIFEAAGRSLLGPRALNCSAPDEGNMHLIGLAATPARCLRRT